MRWQPRHVWRFLANLCYWGVHFLRWDPAIQRQFLRWKLRCWSRRLGRLLGRAGGTDDELTGSDLVDLSAIPEDQRPTWSAHVRALARYRTRPYGGRVTLFRTRGHPLFCSFDPAYGWRELARGGVIVRRVPGAHESILEEPHVRALALEMKASLAQVRPNGTPQDLS
jgi:hypothetical protein